MPHPPNRPQIVLAGSQRDPIDRAGDVPSLESEMRFRALALAALERQRLERGRLARMLHDEVAQILSGAGLQLDILRMDLEEKAPEIVGRTAEIQELLERVVRRIRDLSYDLNPDIVERAGLQPALDLLVGRFRKVFSGGLRLMYDSTVRIPSSAGVALERIAEESVANAIRHGRCAQIEIIFKSTRDGAALEVRDDGTGFDYEKERRVPRGLGLLMMEYCAAKAGLELTVDAEPGRGSSVVAVAPDGRREPHKAGKRPK